MLSITSVTIISVDKDETEVWSIEGEVLFEEDLATPFWATYLVEDDEFEQFEMEIEEKQYDKKLLKANIIQASKDFDEEDFLY